MAFGIGSLVIFFFFFFLFLLGGNNSLAQVREEEEEEGKQRVPLPAVGGGGVATIPALPVEWQASSCLLDFDAQVLGGLQEACGGAGANLDRARCCPVLAAWLMAARAKLALQTPPLPLSPPPPLAAQPGTMPLLPDDSLVCVANMKAALDARGLTLSPPNSSCDVVLCFCGIRLNEMTSAACPNSPNLFGSQTHPITSQATTTTTTGSSELPTESNLPVPLLPITSSSSAPALSPVLGEHNTSSPAKALLANCRDHSYKGCTRCLNTLTKINAGKRRDASLHCDLMGLMSLLATNKTLYIPTVSAVVRALMYNGQPQHRPVCSPDWANMPLALDSTRFQQEKHLASSTSSSSLLMSTSFSPYEWPLISSLLSLLVLLPSHVI